MKILVTGAAGFIGFHLSRRLLDAGYEVVGYDNMYPYYDTSLKENRLSILAGTPGFVFVKASLQDRRAVKELFNSNRFHTVIHLAAQPGVRYSIENPFCYIDSNISGFMNILEVCRYNSIKHLIYASSSSVYGANTSMPYSVHDNVDHPISLYAATKKANELMAHTYSVLYGLPCTGLRFFTVYGPYGRPDMALFSFTGAIFEGRPVQLFNHGRMKRDFTYVDDIVEGIVRLLERIPAPDPMWDTTRPDPGTSFAPYRIYNIGNNSPVELLRIVEILEEKTGKKAVREYIGIQPGEVPETYADIGDLVRDTGFTPHISIEDGIGRFVEWYRKYYGV